MKTSLFISYSWDDDLHLQWISNFALKLKNDSINVILDAWSLLPGDQLPEFMEKSIREVDFVIIICTPQYKIKSEKRTGGVGYEGHIITSEILIKNNHRKFIPILRHGEWIDSSPNWLQGKYYLDFRGTKFNTQNYLKLLQALKSFNNPDGNYSNSKDILFNRFNIGQFFND